MESPVPLTNGRGVFRTALAEFSIASILFFAKDLRRLIRKQEAGRWEQFDVAVVRNQVLGDRRLRRNRPRSRRGWPMRWA